MPISSNGSQGSLSRRDAEDIRVMIVDDSSVIRRVVTQVISAETGMAVVGTAGNGREAIERIDLYRPHVLVLDIEMPVLDGLATLEVLRPRWPTLPVIMFSTLTTRAASATLDALARGANDYAAKPASVGGLTGSMNAVRTRLVPLLRAWGTLGRRRRTPDLPGFANRTMSPISLPGQPGTLVAPRRTGALRAAAVVIGSSAGGPNALAELVPQLPEELPVPVFLAQHMPATFTRLLADRLNDKSRLTVSEAEPGTVARRGHLYVARGGIHMVIRRRGTEAVIEFDDGPAENFCKPAVDPLFRSAASIWGRSLLAVVLTGMGSDGLAGARAVVGEGGTVITQDEASSLVWGMPGSVTKAGLSSEVLPLNLIAGTIIRASAPDRTVVG